MHFMWIGLLKSLLANGTQHCWYRYSTTDMWHKKYQRITKKNLEWLQWQVAPISSMFPLYMVCPKGIKTWSNTEVRVIRKGMDREWRAPWNCKWLEQRAFRCIQLSFDVFAHHLMSLPCWPLIPPLSASITIRWQSSYNCMQKCIHTILCMCNGSFMLILSPDYYPLIRMVTNDTAQFNAPGWWRVIDWQLEIG